MNTFDSIDKCHGPTNHLAEHQEKNKYIITTLQVKLAKNTPQISFRNALSMHHRKTFRKIPFTQVVFTKHLCKWRNLRKKHFFLYLSCRPAHINLICKNNNFFFCIFMTLEATCFLGFCFMWRNSVIFFFLLSFVPSCFKHLNFMCEFRFFSSSSFSIANFWERRKKISAKNLSSSDNFL